MAVQLKFVAFFFCILQNVHGQKSWRDCCHHKLFLCLLLSARWLLFVCHFVCFKYSQDEGQHKQANRHFKLFCMLFFPFQSVYKSSAENVRMTLRLRTMVGNRLQSFQSKRSQLAALQITSFALQNLHDSLQLHQTIS